MPIPDEQRDGKRGMRVRPRGIEVHVYRKRTATPDSNGGEKGPPSLDIFSSERVRKKQAQESIKSRAQGHGQGIRKGEAVCENGGTESPGDKNADVSQEEERRPQDCRANAEMVVEMAVGSAEEGSRPAVFIDARVAKTGIGVLVVASEIEAVLDERSAGVCIVSDSVATYPGIKERERK